MISEPQQLKDDMVSAMNEALEELDRRRLARFEEVLHQWTSIRDGHNGAAVSQVARPHRERTSGKQ